jgi:saccharopine dehydrogenase-like NADP-dependent oxidoreductase
VATEILRACIASGNHDITIFSRSAPKETTPGVSSLQVDYSDRGSLTETLKGFDVCLSFMVVHLDKDCVAQKNLIHACIDAGVQRFAPSEWGMYVSLFLLVRVAFISDVTPYIGVGTPLQWY